MYTKNKRPIESHAYLKKAIRYTQRKEIQVDLYSLKGALSFFLLQDDGLLFYISIYLSIEKKGKLVHS